MKKKATKKVNRKTKNYSDAVREFCRDFLADDDMNGIAIAYLSFKGKKYLKKLPSDAPQVLRDRLEAYIKVINETRPVFWALNRLLNAIDCL